MSNSATNTAAIKSLKKKKKNKPNTQTKKNQKPRSILEVQKKNLTNSHVYIASFPFSEKNESHAAMLLWAAIWQCLNSIHPTYSMNGRALKE